MKTFKIFFPIVLYWLSYYFALKVGPTVGGSFLENFYGFSSVIGWFISIAALITFYVRIYHPKTS